MTTICASCGVSISPSMALYKCRQCVHHFVCGPCEKKTHNRASAAFHTLDEMPIPRVQATTATSSNTSSKFGNNQQQSREKTNSTLSSIFSSERYLYDLLGYCSHCCRTVSMGIEPSFQCQQCPGGFGVCIQCMPLMITHHPSMHTFSKQSLSHYKKLAHDLCHLDITCAGCFREGFNGKRYQCEECPTSYDLCERCFGKEHTHHRLKCVQNPLLHAVNQRSLGERTLKLAKNSDGLSTDGRDPLTGWTKFDAELVVQQANQEEESYLKRLEQIVKNNEEYVKDEERRARQQSDDIQRSIADANDRDWHLLLASFTLGN